MLGIADRPWGRTETPPERNLVLPNVFFVRSLRVPTPTPQMLRCRGAELKHGLKHVMLMFYSYFHQLDPAVHGMGPRREALGEA